MYDDEAWVDRKNIAASRPALRQGDIRFVRLARPRRVPAIAQMIINVMQSSWRGGTASISASSATCSTGTSYAQNSAT
jgi:hypothetical protein